MNVVRLQPADPGLDTTDRGGDDDKRRGGQDGGKGNRGGKAGDNIGGKTRRHNDNILDRKARTAGKNGSQVQGGDAGDNNLHGSSGDLEQGQRTHLSIPVSTSSGDSAAGASDGEFPDDERQVVLDLREQVTKADPPEPAGVHWKVRKGAHRQYREDWSDWCPSFNPADRSTMILLSIGSHSTFPAAVHNLGRAVLGTLWEANKSTDRLILGAQPHYG